MRLTIQTIRALKPASKLYWVDDNTLPGFRVGVTPRGVKTFAVRLRKGARANRRDTTQRVGRVGVLTLDQARVQARSLLSRWALGADLIAERRATRDAVAIAELAQRFLSEWDTRRSTGTVREYRRLFNVEILPAFGKLVARELTRTKVARWHGKIGTRAPIVANRSLRLLRTFYGWAETRGEVPAGTTPTKGVEMFPEHARERFLSPDELGRLGDVLNRAEREGIAPDPKRAKYAERRQGTALNSSVRRANPWAIAAIRFLLLSGWREQEALTLRWDAVDLATGRVTLAATKTGRSQRMLGRGALMILAGLTRVEGSPFVFPGRTPDVPLREIKHIWHAVRHTAGLGDVRLHDLRHTFASAAVMGGTPLFTTGALLGHRDMKSTERYVHFADDPLKSEADNVSSTLAARLEGRVVKVLALRGMKRRGARSGGR